MPDLKSPEYDSLKLRAQHLRETIRALPIGWERLT